MPTFICAWRRFIANCISSTKPKTICVKARQYAPGSLEVMYNEAMLYQAQGRYEDAIRVLSDAVTGVKGSRRCLPSRRRSLAILYQQLGQLYRDRRIIRPPSTPIDELGHLGDEEDRRARLLIMDIYRARARSAEGAADRQRSGREISRTIPPSVRSEALLLGENGQTDEAVKMLRTQLTATPKPTAKSI